MPTSATAAMSEIICSAFLADSPSTAKTLIVPSSWMSILVPVESVMLRIILPPGPITSRIFSVGTVMV